MGVNVVVNSSGAAAAGAAAKTRSGLQKQVLALYRRALLAARKKDAELAGDDASRPSNATEIFVRERFRDDVRAAKRCWRWRRTQAVDLDSSCALVMALAGGVSAARGLQCDRAPAAQGRARPQDARADEGSELHARAAQLSAYTVAASAKKYTRDPYSIPSVTEMARKPDASCLLLRESRTSTAYVTLMVNSLTDLTAANVPTMVSGCNPSCTIFSAKRTFLDGEQQDPVDLPRCTRLENSKMPMLSKR